jgi:lysophospholipase L1-like esterase
MKSNIRYVLITALTVFALFGLVEFLTRLVFSSTSNLNINIGEFKQYHPTRGTTLKPGYKAGAISINSYGFLGPEFQIQRSPGKIRILTIGDSATFSPPPDNYSRVLEKHLNQYFPDNPIEVIVAAVPGYTSYQALDWYSEFLYKLKPDITIIYLGWNDMGQYHPFGLKYKNEGLYTERTFVGSLMENLYFARVPYYFLGVLEMRMPVDMSPLSHEQEKILANFYPTHYEDNLTSIIQKSKLQGSIVYLISLTGRLSYPPTEEDRKIMHFPRNIRKHLKVYQTIYDKYVYSLKKVSAETQTPIIDLDELIKTPEERKIFTDTVHINRKGAERFGLHIANEIRQTVAEIIQRKK